MLHTLCEISNNRLPQGGAQMNRGKLFAIALAASLAFSGTARADMTSDLKAQVDALKRQLEAVKAQLDKVTEDMAKQKQAEQKREAEPARGGPWLERKPGDALTFLTPGGGEVTLYGNMDVSFDYTTKGLQS